jgi:hypothetical protein
MILLSLLLLLLFILSKIVCLWTAPCSSVDQVRKLRIILLLPQSSGWKLFCVFSTEAGYVTEGQIAAMQHSVAFRENKFYWMLHSPVSIVTKLWAVRSGFPFPTLGNFFFRNLHTVPGAHLAYFSKSTRSTLLGVKQTVHKDNYSQKYSVVTNAAINLVPLCLYLFLCMELTFTIKILVASLIFATHFYWQNCWWG